MDYTSDIPFKVEKQERDNNDNLQLSMDVQIKIEEDSETTKGLENDQEVEDWCIPSIEGDELLEPLYFKHVTEVQEPQCDWCCRYFPDWNTIWRHNLSHLQVTIVNPTIFQCDLCPSYFTNKHSMKRHIKAHNCSKTENLSYKPKTYRPNNIFKSETKGLQDGMTNLLSYKPKAYTTESNKTHLCNICHKSYTYKNWHDHMQNVHGVGRFTCGICGMVFKCERYLKRHLSNRHIGKKKGRKLSVKMDVECDQCDAVLQSLYALRTHKRNVHSDTKHVCYICKSTLKCKSYLLAHMRRLHCTDGKKHQCECGKSFKSHRYLMVHKRNSHSKGRNVVVKTEPELDIP